MYEFTLFQLDPSIIFLGVVIGLVAQLVDGALGMGYGVTSNSILLSFGIPPSISSASVHTSEVFTTLSSGVSHLKLGNVDRTMIKRLVVTGIIFGAVGAFVCTSISGNILKSIVAIYLLAMGAIILAKVFGPIKFHIKKRHIPVIGAFAAFFDAVGGGGWGPIATTTLIAGGHNPRLTIGSVNITEFFVTVAEAATFFVILGLSHINIIIGLIIGGVAMAPFAAYTCKKIPTKPLMLVVSLLIIGLSVRTLLLSLA
ncbi:MAG: sulfite exporter TauE/SafE family protein [Candidatus Bathyarchaeota archaeon]